MTLGCLTLENTHIDSINTWFCVLFDSVQDSDAILSEAGTKLDGVRQKIGQIAEELRGEDLYQFHRAFTPGKCSASFFFNNRLK